ncbi:DUF1330 domain-containing protein [Pectobacterium quasiaquaticum]|uniref:DUF1330 domain-containing protein n=1 Tax=Pectobacterium quasiaquaticum TaxID=2774015 RepID=A0A9Q2IDB5_9GAMM|nr:DUF1330 domain-containing protein [Pectobacterium quasiaquaticum]URG49309.1 DUF1330 domain-containing protein [Pectobacterium quasiaquaticum]
MNQPAYFVINVKIHDPEAIKPYQAKVAETYKPFGGERIVAGGLPQTIEGEPPLGRIVILRFPSMELAHAWHDSPVYQAILGYRLAAAESHAYFVEGIA